MGQATSQELDDIIKTKVKEELEAQRSKPFVISVMGQTGVGKSSLINALFNTKLNVDPVRPTTKEMEIIHIKNAKGHSITFCDMPGIGESKNADSVHLASYRKQLLESDVVIWAIHADNRSTVFDVQTIKRLLEGIDHKQRSLLMSKMTFVLTKVDLLMQSPWVAGCIDNHAIFSPGKETKRILEQKATYYQEHYIHPYGTEIIARTNQDGTFTLDDPSFTYTEHSIYYQGLLTQEKVDAFKRKYPQHAQIFDGLYDSYRVIPCSALFKYNLPELMLVTMNKLGPNVFASFKQVVNIDKQSIDLELLDHVPFSRMLKMSNFCIIDVQSGDTVFDLSNSTFPDKNSRSWFHGNSDRDNYLHAEASSDEKFRSWFHGNRNKRQGWFNRIYSGLFS